MIPQENEIFLNPVMICECEHESSWLGIMVYIGTGSSVMICSVCCLGSGISGCLSVPVAIVWNAGRRFDGIWHLRER